VREREKKHLSSSPCPLLSRSLAPPLPSAKWVVMASIPMEHGLLLAGALFALGLIGVLARRNIVFILMSLEIMLNATGLAFVTAGARWAQADGQVMYLFILSMAAAEVAIGLALVLKLKRQFKTLDADAASRMRG
jgi:NADH-quinone oxidoreductase subunit K